MVGQEICEKGWELREPSGSDEGDLSNSEEEPLQHNEDSYFDSTSTASSHQQAPQSLPSSWLPEQSQLGLSLFGRLSPLLKA